MTHGFLARQVDKRRPAWLPRIGYASELLIRGSPPPRSSTTSLSVGPPPGRCQPNTLRLPIPRYSDPQRCNNSRHLGAERRVKFRATNVHPNQAYNGHRFTYTKQPSPIDYRVLSLSHRSYTHNPAERVKQQDRHSPANAFEGAPNSCWSTPHVACDPRLV